MACLQVDHDCSGRWGVILAGGDGKRLLPLTRKLTGEDRPKQFCALSGTDTLLKRVRVKTSNMFDCGTTCETGANPIKIYFAASSALRANL
jgi:Nucleotidyl transferase